MRLPIALGLLALATPAAAAEGDGEIAIDLYFFGQRDPLTGEVAPGGIRKRGGNPVRAEGFDYGAVGTAFDIPVSDSFRVQGSSVLGWIRDEGTSPIAGATGFDVISASPSLLTLDSVLGGAWRIGDWRIAPGAFYHHQKVFFAGGPNLDISRDLNDGNTQLFANTSVRLAVNWQRGWDGEKREHDEQWSANVLMGWRQYWSPEWLTTISAQYARQSGKLHSSFNYVAVYNDEGFVRELVDESLPRIRHRGQLNVRTRYAPMVGWAVGLDVSGYVDRWAVYHGSVEASLEAPVLDAVRVRTWYRFSAQHGTRYFVEMPLVLDGFFTQDSDLGTFVAHSPGLLVTFPVADFGTLRYEGRVSMYGLIRSDGVLAIGGHGGLALSW